MPAPGKPTQIADSRPDEAPAVTVLDNRYRLDSILGRGAMGVVYRAMDLRLDRPVAVKLLAESSASDEGFGCGVWGLKNFFSAAGGVGDLAFGLGSLATGVGLLFYERYALKKLKNMDDQ